MPRWPLVNIFETLLRLSKEIKPKQENSTTFVHKNAHSYISRMFVRGHHFYDASYSIVQLQFCWIPTKCATGVIFSNNRRFTPEITGVIQQSNVNFIISCTVGNRTVWSQVWLTSYKMDIELDSIWLDWVHRAMYPILYAISSLTYTPRPIPV